MSFFSDEKTEIELFQEEINNNARSNNESTYILELDDFEEIKIGAKGGDIIKHNGKLSIERDGKLSDRRRDLLRVLKLSR